MTKYIAKEKNSSLIDKYKEGKKRSEENKRSSKEYFYEVNGYNKQAGGDNSDVKRLENIIRTEVSNIVKHFEATYFTKFITAIKNYSLVGVDRMLELKKQDMGYRTNVVQPIVRTYVDRLVQSLFRTNFFIKAYPIAKSNKNKVDLIQAIVERGFSSSKAKKALLDVGTEAILTGVGYIRSGFDSMDFTVEQYSGEDKEAVEIEEFLPRAEWVSEFNIFGEPHVNFNEQRFIIYRKVLPINKIKQKVNKLNPLMSQDLWDIIINTPEVISTKNFDKVRLIKYYEEKIMKEKEFSIDNFYEATFGNDFCEYIERRSKGNLIILVNGYIVFDGKNPLDGRVSPFHYVNSSNNPGTWIADGIGTLLEGPQKLYDALYNVSFDLIKFQAGPMFMLQPGSHIKGSGKTLPYRPLGFLEIEGPGKIETFPMPTPDPSVFKGMTDILNMTNMAISPSSYSQFQGVSRSATDAQARLEGLKDSVVVLVNNINRILTEIADVWLLEIKNKMPKKFSIPIFGDNGKIKTRKTIKVDDLKGKYLFERDSDSIRDINKMVERSQLNELTNLVKSFGKDPSNGQRMVNTKKLLKQGLELFNQDPGIVLTDEEYKQKTIAAQTLGMEIQKELSDVRKKLIPEYEQINGIGPTSKEVGGEPIQRPTMSNYNNNPNPMQQGEPKRQGGIDLAGMLKAANE